jgi:hypothetical protein
MCHPKCNINHHPMMSSDNGSNRFERLNLDQFSEFCLSSNLGLDHRSNSMPCPNLGLDFGQVLKGSRSNRGLELNLGIPSPYRVRCGIPNTVIISMPTVPLICIHSEEIELIHTTHITTVISLFIRVIIKWNIPQRKLWNNNHVVKFPCEVGENLTPRTIPWAFEVSNIMAIGRTIKSSQLILCRIVVGCARELPNVPTKRCTASKNSTRHRFWTYWDYRSPLHNI